MIGEIIKSLVKQLIVIAIVIAISIAIMSVNQTAGIILMMLYSSFMVIKSSNKEIPLNKFSAILPGLMSLAIFFIMLGLIDVHNEDMPLIGLGLGIIPGWLMARGHKVYKKDGIVYAKRTFFYVFIWAISILFTQGSTLLGMREVTDFGFLLNGFSTAMMVVLSLILFLKTIGKHNLKTNTLSGISLLLTTVSIFTLSQISEANTFSSENKAILMQNVGKYVFSNIPRPPDITCNWGNVGCKVMTFPEKVNYIYFHGRIDYWNKCRTAPLIGFHLYLDKQFKQKAKKSFYEFIKHYPSHTKTQYRGGVIHTQEYANNRLLIVKYLFEYKQWLLEVSMVKQRRVKYKACDESTRKYIFSVLNHSIDRLKKVNIQGGKQSHPNSNLTPPSNPKSSESSSFSDVIAELTSDKNLESISYDNWINNKQNNSTQNQTNNDPDSDSEFSDDELAAGVLTALLMLLASLGLNASMLVAQGAASAAESATQDAASNTYGDGNDDYVRGTKILDGDEAKEWMILHGYIKDDSRPELFQEGRLNDFMNFMPTEKDPGLQGFADDRDNGNGYVILVDDESVQMPQDVDKSSNNDNLTETNDSKKRDDDSEENTSNETESNDNTITTITDDSDDSSTSDTDNKKTSNNSTQDTTKDVKDTKLETTKEEVLPIDYSHVREDLENVMSDIIQDKIDDGYYVRNPHSNINIMDKYLPDLVNKASLPIRMSAHMTDFGESLFHNYVTKNFEEYLGWKGGQCGDYAQHGIDWSSEKIKETYGDDVKFDKIIVKSNIFPDRINHAATRVTLPNGDTYVLDYWEGIQNGEKRVYTEEAWVKRHSEKLDTLGLGTETDSEESTNINANLNAASRTHKELLDKYIDKRGEDEGKKLFLEHIRKKADKNDLKDAMDLVTQWRKK